MKKLILVFLGLLSLGAATTFAQGDVMPPELVELHITPDHINTVNSPQTITITARFTDDLSGFHDANIVFIPEIGTTQNHNVRFRYSEVDEGNPLDGIYVNTLTLPQFSAEGWWVIGELSVADMVGNWKTYTESNTDGFPEYLREFRFYNGESIPDPTPTPTNEPTTAPTATLTPSSETTRTPISTLWPIPTDAPTATLTPEPPSTDSPTQIFIPTVKRNRAATPPPQSDFPYTVGGVNCVPNAEYTYFQGFVRDHNNNPINGVCVHIHFYEPRNTKCSGCDSVGDGVWGFSPFGGPAPPGTPVEIFVVSCEGDMPEGGQTLQTGFGDLTPQSPKWTRVIQESEQCTGITFYRRESPPSSQPSHAGPCSQCKFRLSEGPSKRANDGLELKIQADFIHSGVDGGQRQGNYSIGIEKDGVLIEHFSTISSTRLNYSNGPMGPYNYEASIDSSSLQGGTVAGRYFFWVLDGNGQRDSEIWTLDLADDEGEVWIRFDQN